MILPVVEHPVALHSTPLPLGDNGRSPLHACEGAEQRDNGRTFVNEKPEERARAMERSSLEESFGEWVPADRERATVVDVFVMS